MKTARLIALFALGLLSLAACNLAHAQGWPPGALQLAAEDDDEEDEEEEAVNYRDKVREIQQWMNRRDSERKGEAPTLDVTPAPPAYPRYYRDSGSDAGGYRRLDREVRARLGSAPEAGYTPRHHRHSYRSWHKRWRRHVSPVVHARHHRHHYHSRHRHSEGVSRHYHGHGKHGRAFEAPARGKHAAKAPAPRHAAKAAPPARHAAAKARPAKAAPAKKPAAAPKKGRSKR